MNPPISKQFLFAKIIMLKGVIETMFASFILLNYVNAEINSSYYFFIKLLRLRFHKFMNDIFTACPKANHASYIVISARSHSSNMPIPY